MPVKVRCPGCDKVLNAPDAARGKAVKCPQCATKVRVPAGTGDVADAPRVPTLKRGGTAATASKPSAKRPARRAADEDDFLGGLDLDRMEDQRHRVCQKCGATVSAEDIECPECGINLATGQLSEKMARKMSRRGPDPAEFYGKAWSDSWQFLMENKGLAWKTGFYWTLFATLFVLTYSLALWCERTPPKVFWAGLAVLCYFGLPGWYWFLTGEVIKVTLQKKRRIKELHFDFLMNVALGLKAGIWPVFLILPFAWFPPAALLPMLAFPVAMVHMTQPYTYKAWLPWDMTQIVFKNIAPVLYWLIMSFVVNILFVVGLAVAGLVFPDAVMDWGLQTITKATEWALGMAGATPEEPGLIGYAVIGLVISLCVFLMIAPVMIAAAWPAVFMMRANGLFAYYNNRTLDLVQETSPNVPAGFWVRYLAFMADLLILASSLGVIWGIGWVGSRILTLMGVSPAAIAPLAYAFIGACILIPFAYFTRGESGPLQSTIGKRSLGLIVTDMEYKQITTGAAIGRFFGRLLSALPAGIGLMMAAFTEKKQTLHDTMTKTQVVWRGDDESTTR